MSVEEKPILIIDDEESDALLLQSALRAAGIANRIVALPDGADVMLYLKGIGGYSDRSAYPFPAALFLNLKLRRISGFRVLEWLKEHPELRPLLVVALTGTREFKIAEMACQFGANTFLTKPFSPADINSLKLGFKQCLDVSPPPPTVVPSHAVRLATPR